MSPKRKNDNTVWVMQEASRHSLPEEEIRRRRTVFNRGTKKYEDMKKKKVKKLQFVLEKNTR